MGTFHDAVIWSALPLASHRTQKMARKRSDNYEDKQRNILDSAAAVFAELGMQKASMTHIATRAEVSKALLYHYYTSKSDLIYDIVRTHLEELENALKEQDQPGLEPDERLRLLVQKMLEKYQHADNQHIVQLNYARVLTAEQSKELRSIERRITHRFSALFALINPELDEKSVWLMPVTMSLFGILNWVYLWFRPDGDISREEYGDMVVKLLLNGVNGIR